jgi:transposase-like protein
MNLVISDRKKCRRCNKGKLDTRVKRGILVKAFLFWLPIKRYRCDACNRKSYAFGSQFKNLKQRELQIL